MATESSVIVLAVLLVTSVFSFGYFKSAIDAALILMHVPFALAGGIISLRLTGAHLNAATSVGFISVLSIAVLNAVLFLASFNELRRLGMPLKEAVLRGTEVRLRAVLITALLVIVGLLPAAFSKGIAGAAHQQLAVVMIGGLISSTLFTLLALPASYMWLHARDAARTAASGHPRRTADGGN